MLYAHLKNTNNHSRQPKETQLRQYFVKALFYKAFRLLKVGFLALFALFSPYFRTITNIQYNKKTQKPLYFLRFRVLLFSPYKN